MTTPDPRISWRKQHRGMRSDGRWKAAYALEREAARAAARMDREMPCPPLVRGVYECRWGARPEAGETAPLHWHVGRTRP